MSNSKLDSMIRSNTSCNPCLFSWIVWRDNKRAGHDPVNQTFDRRKKQK